MTDKELLTSEIENFANYVKSRKELLALSNKAFSQIVGVSDGEISKIINQKKKSVSLYSFYNIALKSGDTIENVRDFVYKQRNLNIQKVFKLESRTNFGLFMRDSFEGENTFEIIQAKTGINKQRLSDLYFKTSAPEPYELLLIEKAVGKKVGEMITDYVQKYLVDNKE